VNLSRTLRSARMWMCEARSARAADSVIVEGGRRLTGAIAPSGNKNAALLPIIAAALLTEHPVTLKQRPRGIP